MTGYDNLKNWFRTNAALKKHGYSLIELENMIPWERHVYIDYLKQEVEAENARIRDQMAARRK